MHEFGIIEGILRAVQEKVDPAQKVVQINLSYGKVSGLIPAHIEAHFRQVVKGTPLEKVKLNFQEAPDYFQELCVDSIEVQ